MTAGEIEEAREIVASFFLDAWTHQQARPEADVRDRLIGRIAQALAARAAEIARLRAAAVAMLSVHDHSLMSYEGVSDHGLYCADETSAACAAATAVRALLAPPEPGGCSVYRPVRAIEGTYFCECGRARATHTDAAIAHAGQIIRPMEPGATGEGAR